MMKTLTLEDLEAVTGGIISIARQFVLTNDTMIGIIIGISLQKIQDLYCNTDEERSYVKKIYDDLVGE